jgi:hypothetical protein
MRFLTVSAIVALGLSARASESTAEQVYKNIQVLKGTPALELGPIMDVMEAALGVGCGHCHARSPDGKGMAFDSDDKAAKRTARKMVTMTQAINKQFFGGDQIVSCATCHAGSPEPKSVVALDALKPPVDKEGPKPHVTPKQLFDQWLAASGGAAAWKRPRTRLSKGTFSGHGPALPIEIAQAAPQRYDERLDAPRGPIDLVWTGTSGWRAIQTTTRPLPPQEVARLRREAPLAPPLVVPKLLTDAKIAADAPAGGGNAHVVVARQGDEAVRLYFDDKSGLLVRVAVLVPTPIGDLPEQWDYEDFRTVDGIKLPFTVRATMGNERSTVTFTSIEHDVALDDKRFTQPQGK